MKRREIWGCLGWGEADRVSFWRVTQTERGDVYELYNAYGWRWEEEQERGTALFARLDTPRFRLTQKAFLAYLRKIIAAWKLAGFWTPDETRLLKGLR